MLPCAYPRPESWSSALSMSMQSLLAYAWPAWRPSPPPLAPPPLWLPPLRRLNSGQNMVESCAECRAADAAQAPREALGAMFLRREKRLLAPQSEMSCCSGGSQGNALMRPVAALRPFFVRQDVL